MIEARLGVVTCDKCGMPMKAGKLILLMAEGAIAASDDELTFSGSCVGCGCHLDYWSSVERDDI